MSTKVYPTREDYAREVWASLDSATQTDILADYGMTTADDEFFGYFAENMDAHHNGTVTFTRTEGGYIVDDEAVS